MNDTRFPTDAISQPPLPPAGFLVVSVAPTDSSQASPMQWLYQQLYQQAQQMHQAPRVPDLFANMN